MLNSDFAIIIVNIKGLFNVKTSRLSIYIKVQVSWLGLLKVHYISLN